MQKLIIIKFNHTNDDSDSDIVAITIPKLWQTNTLLSTIEYLRQTSPWSDSPMDTFDHIINSLALDPYNCTIEHIQAPQFEINLY